MRIVRVILRWHRHNCFQPGLGFLRETQPDNVQVGVLRLLE
jgi:hypothetical protein